jgi:hypothetical protein
VIASLPDMTLRHMTGYVQPLEEWLTGVRRRRFCVPPPRGASSRYRRTLVREGPDSSGTWSPESPTTAPDTHGGSEWTRTTDVPPMALLCRAGQHRLDRRVSWSPSLARVHMEVRRIADRLLQPIVSERLRRVLGVRLIADQRLVIERAYMAGAAGDDRGRGG